MSNLRHDKPMPDLKSPARGMKTLVRPERANGVSETGMPPQKKGLRQIKSQAQKGPFQIWKAHARVERVKVGPARTQARLEKAYYVARGFTLLGCFQAREFCSSQHRGASSLDRLK